LLLTFTTRPLPSPSLFPYTTLFRSVPLRSRKDSQIHVFPSSDVFVHGAVGNPTRCDFGILFGVLPPGLNQFHFAGFRGQPKSQSDTARRCQGIRQDSKSLWITFNFVEQDCRQLHSSLKLVHNNPELDITIGSLDLPQFPRGFHQRDPVTKILNSHFIPSNS